MNWLFESIYCDTGRESIPPERLIRAQLLQVLYSIRSERQLVEQINYNLLYRWFVGLTIEDAVWNHSTFSINRDRLLEHDVVGELFEQVLSLASRRELLSQEHFSVDGTLIQAWASQKSYRPKDEDDEPPSGQGRNAEANFHGEKRSNTTHESKTDSDARMAKKGPGKEAKLAYMGHTVMENRHGLIVKAQASHANGKAEREVALDLLAELPGLSRCTVGADKNYDTAHFVQECRAMNIDQTHRASSGDAFTRFIPLENGLVPYCSKARCCFRINLTQGYLIHRKQRPTVELVGNQCPRP